MAAPKVDKHAEPAQAPSVDDIDDPEEFTADAPQNGTIPRSNVASIDDLNDVTFDTRQREEDYRRLNPPQGDWLKTERWNFDREQGVFFKEDDKREGDINPRGRTYLRFDGNLAPQTRDGITYSPQASILVSPDKRWFDESNPNDFDNAYKHYMSACEVFMAIHGKKLTRPSELVYFFTEDNFTVNSYNGNRGFTVKQIKQTKSKR